MKKVFIAAVVLLLLLVAGWLIYPKIAYDNSPNSLSYEEEEEGWILLFDGESIDKWHTYGGEGVGPAWRIDDEALHLYVPERAGNKTEGGGSLVTNESFSGDFELKLDWKIDKLTNSGVFLFVKESPEYQQMHNTGLELQVTDNAIYEGADERNNKRAGDFFGIKSTGLLAVKPVGEWNYTHIIHQNDSLKVYINDLLVHNIDLNSPEWKNAIAQSNLKEAPISKDEYEGRVGLQDWGSPVWFRNIKLRPLTDGTK